MKQSSPSTPTVPSEFVRALDRALAEESPEAYSALAGALADLPTMGGKTPTPADVRRVIEAERAARRRPSRDGGVSLGDLAAAIASAPGDAMEIDAADIALLRHEATYESKGALHLHPLCPPARPVNTAPSRTGRRSPGRAPTRRKGSRRRSAASTPSGGGGDPDPDGESDPDPARSGAGGERLCGACNEPRCKKGERTCSRCRKRAQRDREAVRTAASALTPSEPSEAAAEAAPRCNCPDALALRDEDGQPVCVNCGRATSPPGPWPINGYDSMQALMLSYAEDDGSGGVRLRSLHELVHRPKRQSPFLVTRTAGNSHGESRAAA